MLDHQAHRMLNSDEQDSVTYTVSLAVSLVFLVGSIFIIVSWVKFEQLRKPAFEHVLNLSIADALISLSMVLNGDSENGSWTCTAQAFLQQWFELSSVLWTTVIAFTLYLAIMKRADVTRFRAYFYCWAWVLPFVVACLPFSTNSYGSTGAWCVPLSCLLR